MVGVRGSQDGARRAGDSRDQAEEESDSDEVVGLEVEEVAHDASVPLDQIPKVRQLVVTAAAAGERCVSRVALSKRTARLTLNRLVWRRKSSIGRRGASFTPSIAIQSQISPPVTLALAAGVRDGLLWRRCCTSPAGSKRIPGQTSVAGQRWSDGQEVGAGALTGWHRRVSPGLVVVVVSAADQRRRGCNQEDGGPFPPFPPASLSFARSR